jgi:hypothetical protein
MFLWVTRVIAYHQNLCCRFSKYVKQQRITYASVQWLSLGNLFFDTYSHSMVYEAEVCYRVLDTGSVFTVQGIYNKIY